MKVIFYQDEKKITINNVSIPNTKELSKLINIIQEEKLSKLNISDLKLYKFNITSTRGMIDDNEEITDETLEREVEEGIRWNSETVN